MLNEIRASGARLYVPAFRDLIAGRVDKPVVLLSGSRGSAKSTSAAQAMVRAALKGHFKRQVMVRKWFRYIRESQYADIAAFHDRLGIAGQVEAGPSRLHFAYPNGAEIISIGLDKSKVKSLSGVGRAWVEEATELTAQDWIDLKLTVLRGGGNPQIILSYNPRVGSWINDEFFHPDGSPRREDTYYLHTTYKDNPFVGDTFRRTIESLGPDLYRIHGLGLLVRPQGLVFPDFQVVEAIPEHVPCAYGVDKGFNDPFAVVKVGYANETLYWHEVAYHTQRTNREMMALLSGEEKRRPWYIDDSAADTVREFVQAGFNARRAGKGRIMDGVNRIRQCRLRITASSARLLKEIGTYCFHTDPSGATSDYPAPGQADHALDAARYASLNMLVRPVETARPTGIHLPSR